MTGISLTLTPLTALGKFPRSLCPLLFLCYSCWYATSHPPHHLPISCAFYTLGYMLFRGLWRRNDRPVTLALNLNTVLIESITVQFHLWVFLLQLNGLIFAVRKSDFFTQHMSVYWMIIAGNLGGVAHGMRHEDWSKVLWVRTGDITSPLSPFAKVPRMAYPLIFLLYSTQYARFHSHPPLHTEMSVIGFVVGFLFFHFTSAPSAGKPNNAEKWLKEWGLVPGGTKSDFGFSMNGKFLIGVGLDKYDNPKTSYVVNFHLHHWVYLIGTNTLCFLIRKSSFFAQHRLVYWAMIAGGFGGITQGLKYEDWDHVLFVTRKAEKKSVLVKEKRSSSRSKTVKDHVLAVEERTRRSSRGRSKAAAKR